MTALLGAAVVLVSALIKGAIGFGFPTLGTPLLALFVDVKTAIVVLIVPNIVMDGIQALRRGGDLRATARRLALLILFGAVGTVVGTKLLVILPGWIAMLILGSFILVFVAINTTRWELRVPARWEPWVSPPVGFLAGIIGGLTNVPGTPLVMYFYALRMDKRDFVRSVGFSFVIYKLVQLGSVTYFGLLSWRLFGVSVLLTAVALTGFGVGVRVQDRLDPRVFNRAVLVFLAGLGLWIVFRALA